MPYKAMEDDLVLKQAAMIADRLLAEPDQPPDYYEAWQRLLAALGLSAVSRPPPPFSTALNKGRYAHRCR